MRTGIIFVDSKKCLGCKRCYIACAMEDFGSNDIIEFMLSGETASSCVEYRPVGGRVVPIECRHCEGAPCAVACPTGAIGRTSEGAPVLLKPELCVGCRSCVVACPYGAIRISDRTGKIYKCTQCIERTQAGKEPACVEACPTHCLTYETSDSLEAALNVPQEVTVSLVQAARMEGD
jgi:carbon-monoxide dehydrogenase iron sulfur subunit